MGRLRDLKKANEAYWGGKLSRDDLISEGKRLRLAHWQIQKDAGVDIIPSNDFAFYDHVLDHIQMFNVSFPRFSSQETQQLTKIFLRPFQSVTPSTTFTSSMSTLPWVVDTKRRASMFRHW